MGKYFKEEETSNRIKRFKTSDTQEKTLRFAQVSRVTTLLDSMLDFAKTKLFKIFLKAPALLKVRDKIKEDLKDAFIAIIRANISAVFAIKRDMQPILDEINTLKTRQAELQKSLKNITEVKARNETIAELEKIKRDLSAKEKELEPLNEKLAGIETSTKTEINAKIEEFNRVNDLTSPISWNQDLANPKIEFLLGVPVSVSGVGTVLNRAREKQPLNILNFLNQFKRGGAQLLDGIIGRQYENKLRSIGFFDKKYKFQVLEGDEWKDKTYSLGDLLELINNGALKRQNHKPLNETVKATIITDFEKFLEESDKIEKGMLSPFVRAGIVTVASLAVTSPAWVPIITTSPLRVKKQQDLKDPKKRKQDTSEARTNLSLSEREQKKIKELESILLNPNLSPTLREQVRGQIERLKGKK